MPRGSLYILIVVALSFLPATYAQDGTTVYQKLNQNESVLFGKPESSLPIEKRLQNIEKQLFGKAKKGGSISERIDAVEKIVSGSKYLPPVAPEMDRSEFAPLPKKAPENPSLSTKDAESETKQILPAADSDRIKGLLRQAMQYYSQGKIADAERLYEQVLAIDFRNADANYNLGAIAESKKDFNSARRYYTAALRANPGDYDIQDALKAIQQNLRNEMPAGASRLDAPDRTEAGPVAAGDKAIAAVAAASYKNGNFDDAIQRLAYLARKNPFDANTQFALGQAFRGKGDTANASKHLRSAASLDPKNDLYVKTLNEIESQTEDRDMSANGNTAYGNMPSRHSGQSGSNDVTPFVGLPDSSSSSKNSDLADVENYLRRNSGSGVMIGSVTGFGNPLMGGNFFGGTGGMPLMLGTPSGATRLTRVMGSSLSGAAIGAMTNMRQPGGWSKGAMRGAMYGGLFGLVTGGF